MENIKIQRVTEADIDQLQKIGKTTFFETFADNNTEENMAKYLNENFSLDKLHIELTNPEAEFYFAFQNKQLIGYLKVNFGQAQTELQDKNAVEIERIYVLEEFHGKKAGQILFEKALQIAKQKQAVYMWLGVWEKNARAISFYKKNGFLQFDTHIFTLGDEEQTDIMMKLELESSGK